MKRFLFLFAFSLFTLSLLFFPNGFSRTTAIIAFLDIGQGDAIFVESPGGIQMLVDGGRGKQILGELGKVMPPADRSIDVVIATHPDADHIGGLVDVFRTYDVSRVLITEAESDTSAFRALVEAIQNEGAEIIHPKRGDRIHLGKVDIDVLYPEKSVTGGDTNSSSIVTRISYGATSVLLTGDAPKAIETLLVAHEKEKLDVDILKLGHHGSRTSSSKSFLEAASPLIAIISAGEGNTYGHPHQEVMDLLHTLAIPSLITFHEGTIIFKTDGEHLWRAR